MSMDHVEENYVRALESRVKELEESIKLYRGAIVESGELKKENARLRKVIDETCPRSSECSKMSKVVEAARDVEKIYWDFEKTMAPQVTILKNALRDLDGVSNSNTNGDKNDVSK